MNDPTKIIGWMLESELDWLYHTAAQSKSIIEIGVWRGRSTSAICNGLLSHLLPENDNNGKLIAIDNYSISKIDNLSYEELKTNRAGVIREAKANLKNYINIGILKLLEASSDEAYHLLKVMGVTADFIFIDGDHEASQVKNDCKNYRNLLVPNGIISGHDIHLPQVKAAVEEFIGKDYQVQDSIWWKRL